MAWPMLALATHYPWCPPIGLRPESGGHKVRRDILASVGTGALFILFDVLLGIKSLAGIVASGRSYQWSLGDERTGECDEWACLLGGAQALNCPWTGWASSSATGMPSPPTSRLRPGLNFAVKSASPGCELRECPVLPSMADGVSAASRAYRRAAFHCGAIHDVSCRAG